MNFGNSGTSYGGGALGELLDFAGAHQSANKHAGNSGESDLFSNALNMISGRQEHIAQGHVDEEAMVRHHQSFFGGGGGGGQNATSGAMGSAAAMEALKMFQGGSGSGSKNEFVGMAMAQASKLFDNQAAQGNVASGASKQSAVEQAGEMALKMYMKSEMGGGGGGGLMSLASKFM